MESVNDDKLMSKLTFEVQIRLFTDYLFDDLLNLFKDFFQIQIMDRSNRFSLKVMN